MKKSQLFIAISGTFTLLLIVSGLYIAGAFNLNTNNAQAEDVIFVDDFENGTNGWTTSIVNGGALNCLEEWGLETGDAHSGTNAWNNSPYQMAGQGHCFNYLTSPAFEVPAETQSLIVQFWHHHIVEGMTDGTCPCDFGEVEISNNGTSWTTISPMYLDISAGDGTTYQQVTLPVTSGFAPGADLQMRFKFTSDALAGNIGWFVDDVRVVAIQGEAEALFFDDMENGTNGWTVSSQGQNGATLCVDEWALEPGDANSGLTAWNNAPYQGAGTAGECLNYLQSPVIAVPANASDLNVGFWHHYMTEAGFDTGTVETSTDGTNWTPLSPAYSGTSAGSPAYIQESLGVAPSNFTPGGDFHLRFAFSSDSNLTELGWFIDDVLVTATLLDDTPTPPPITPTPTATPQGGSNLPNPEVDHGITFSPIVLVDPQRDVAEPSLRVDKNGNVYACGPFGASRAAEYAQKSEDNGDTFRVLGQAPEGRISTGGGGDCELAVGTDPLPSGDYNLAYTGLEALLNFSTASSQNSGRSFFGQSLGVLDTAVDRQWMEGAFESTVYLGYNSIGIGYQVARSDDGGLTYLPPVAGATDVGRPGPIRVDVDTTHTSNGNEIVYFVYDRTSGQGGVGLSRSLDRGATWTQTVVGEGFDGAFLFPSLAIDTDGNLYAAWTEADTYDLYYSYSLFDDVAGYAGDTWAPKRRVNRHPVQTTLMPWIEAGDPGRISISYYGTESDGNPQTGDFNATWDVYINTSFDALNPVSNANGSVDFSHVKVTTHPVHWDSICTSGLGCSLPPEGDRTLLDFFQNRVAPDGSLHVVYNQSNKIPQEANGRVAIVSYSKQTGGPGLYNSVTPAIDPRPNIRTSSADGEGDALFPFSEFAVTPTIPQTNMDGMDITNVEIIPQDCLSPSEAGTFDVVLTLKDGSTTALDAAIATQVAAGSPAASLQFVVRWFAGLDPYSVVAAYETTAGFTFGFNDLSFATVTGSKLEIYPGDDFAVTGVHSGNTITMTVSPSDFNTIDYLPSGTDPAAPRAAAIGDMIHSVTAFTFGNQNADSTLQEYLNQGDSTAPFDYFIVDGTSDTPVLPAQAIAEFGVGGAKINWDLNGANLEYNLYRSLNPYFDSDVDAPFFVTSGNSFVDPDVVNDVDNNYFYEVRGVSNCGGVSAKQPVHIGEFTFDIVPGMP